MGSASFFAVATNICDNIINAYCNQDETKRCKSYVHDSFKILHGMRKEGLFCDVTIVIQNIEIPAHRNVLAATSRYFYAMLTDGFQEAKQDRIEISGIEHKTFISIMNYLYGEDVAIDDDNVQDILSAADMLLLTSLKGDCFNYLRHHIGTDNCLDIKALGNTFGHEELLNTANTFINNNFSEILVTEAFLKLSYEDLKDLLSREVSKQISQEVVYESLMAWLKHDLKSRRKYSGALIPCVDLPQISAEYIKSNIVNESILMGDLRCNRLIIDALLENCTPTLVEKKHPPIESTITTRGCVKVTLEGPLASNLPSGTLFILGGDGQAGLTYEYSNFNNKHDSRLYNTPRDTYAAGSVNIDQTIYVVGGFKRGRSVKHVFQYDLNSGSWSQSVDMITERTRHGVAFLNGAIYVIGGRGKHCNSLKTVEKYDVQTQQWSFVAAMSTDRWAMGVAVMNNNIYVIGGSNDNNDGDGCKSVERYDPESNTWSAVPHMNVPRLGMGTAVLDNKLYVVGGWNSGALNTVEVYNRKTNRWLEVAPMNIARNGVAVVSASKQLCASGGYNEIVEAENSMEIYDPKQNKWTILPNQMRTRRAYHYMLPIK